MKKYNLSHIMKTAWALFRKGIGSFAQALRAAWYNAKAILKAKLGAGIEEETRTWYSWSQHGMEVIHGSKCLFQATVIDPSTKKGTAIKSFFGASQVAPIVVAE